MLFKILLPLVRTKGCSSDYPAQENQASFDEGLASSEEFFRRFEGKVDFKGKSVLDVGCGLGSTCYYMALRGAGKTVGIDINEGFLSFAKSKITDYPEIAGKIEFCHDRDIGHEKFDVVLSKDSFEHYANPELFITTLKSYVKDNGRLVIGFSPLWKSPFGGHMSRYSKFPWVHLLFPEKILIDDLRRFFKDDSLMAFENLGHGLNKMTLSRYLQIVHNSGMIVEFFKTNVSSSFKTKWMLRIFDVFRLVPFLKEYFTVNIYSILAARNLKIEMCFIKQIY